ncbi:GNL3L/Grn1 putative GTPase-domain-containing protein [Zopfochytrium polystomum]|nr:GNL3L/Grn1 putative GTPase-domain-containing protein [Zopfochytrium polystomum]
MVKKKAKSKRQPAKMQYKIRKKVNEHNRKMRKNALKNPRSRKRVKKDPGIPNSYPFKEELLQQIETKKQQAELEKSLEKAARRQQKAVGESGSLSAQVASQLGTTKTNDEEQPLAGPARVKPVTTRTKSLADLRHVLEVSDVILEVVDARDPMGSRARPLEQLLLNSGLGQQIILVVTRIDLVPKDNLKQWLQTLRKDFPTVAVKASDCGGGPIGGESLAKMLNLASRSSVSPTKVGIIGFPNVGKFSVASVLEKHKSSLDARIQILPNLGRIYAKSLTGHTLAMVHLRNCEETPRKPKRMAAAIYSLCIRRQLPRVLKITQFQQTFGDFLVQLARRDDYTRRHGYVDTLSAARRFIRDWRTGLIPYYTSIPSTFSPLSTSDAEKWYTDSEMAEFVVEEERDVLGAVAPKFKVSDMLTMTSGIEVSEIETQLPILWDESASRYAYEPSDGGDENMDEDSDLSDDVHEDEDEESTHEMEAEVVESGEEEDSSHLVETEKGAHKAPSHFRAADRPAARVLRSKPAAKLRNERLYDFAEHF